MFPHSIITAVNIGLAKRSAKDTLARATYNDFTSNDARNFEKAEKAKFDDTVGSETPNTKKVALRMARCPRKIYWNWQIKPTNSIMKEVKIEYNKILPTFYCGLTAFSNLLQPLGGNAPLVFGCGLTPFSNLLQPVSSKISRVSELWLDRIF